MTDRESVALLLSGCDLQKSSSALQLKKIKSDGSFRRFFRVTLENGESVMAIFPHDSSPVAMSEAMAAWKIGSHLASVGVPVPAMYGFDDRSGLLLCEDLGDSRLHDLVVARKKFDGELLAIYKEIVRQLAHMQVYAREGFNTDWCWDTPVYDRFLMLNRESLYFLNALCKDTLHLEVDENPLMQEFVSLADRASRIGPLFFLFRDFQCRNIMIKGEQPRFIDFQGGRLGPLAYDLASLLIDPYASLAQPVQEELINVYMDALKQESIQMSTSEFLSEFQLLAVQRNLQILGAFGFLTTHRGKVFFRPFIKPALSSLQSLLVKPELGEYSVLRQLTDICLKKVCDVF